MKRDAEAVRTLRTRQNLTQAQLAARSRVARTALVRLESGGKVRHSTLRSIVQGLGFTLLDDVIRAAGERNS